MKRGLAIACLTIALTGDVASAAGPHVTGPEPHPDVPHHPTWVKGVLTGVLLLFAFAIPVGIIIRANMPEAPPEPHDHDAGAHGHDEHAQPAPPSHGHH